MDAGETWRDCNAAQRDVLYALRVEGRATGHALAAATDRSEAAVSRALEALADDGLVERTDAPDVRGKGKYNELTAKGRAVTTAAFSAYNEAI